MKPELKDLVIIIGMNIFGFGLWYFAKYHLNFDDILFMQYGAKKEIYGS